jgi:hypothetical protein
MEESTAKAAKPPTEPPTEPPAKPPAEPPAEAPKKAKKAKKSVEGCGVCDTCIDLDTVKPTPMFFVELGTTLREMRKAERAHRISSLKIA